MALRERMREGGAVCAPVLAEGWFGAGGAHRAAELRGFRPLLDALDGVAWLTDADGIVLGYSGPAWQRFATDNEAPELAADGVLGRSLFDFVGGGPVLDATRRLHERCCRLHRRVVYDYRCDSPRLERSMRMALSPVDGADGPLVLYQSVLLGEAARARIGLFDRRRREASAGVGEPPITLCSYCHDVRWPAGDAADSWIAPTEHYRRGGSDSARVSHGICPRCYERVIAEEG